MEMRVEVEMYVFVRGRRTIRIHNEFSHLYLFMTTKENTSTKVNLIHSWTPHQVQLAQSLSLLSLHLFSSY